MTRRSSSLFAACVLALAATACSDATKLAPSVPSGDADAATDGAATDAASADAGSDATPANMTIAQAVEANITTPITVTAIVTALHGAIPNDVTEWYIEDLAGGPHSGVAVYCDPLLAKCPASIRAPGRWSVVQITGKLSPYQGMMEFIPTAQTVISDAGTPPPIPTVTMADVAPNGASPYRGVLVQLAAGTTLTVDNVTPSALQDTKCTSILSADAGASDAPANDAATADGAADASQDAATTDASIADAATIDAASPDAATDSGAAVDAGTTDATLSDAAPTVDASAVDAATSGLLSCATPCSPPAYSGFTANDGKGNEVNIEATFFATDPLQSSPECLTQPNVVPVTIGKTFTTLQGILDYDGYAKQQQLSPVTAADYTMK